MSSKIMRIPKHHTKLFPIIAVALRNLPPAPVRTIAPSSTSNACQPNDVVATPATNRVAEAVDVDTPEMPVTIAAK
jgi:hypothetical protein